VLGVRLSSRAAADLAEIAEFTIECFGIEQARRYGNGLKDCFRRLAESPELGQSAEELSSGLKRYLHQSHIVF
jgi:toxin ParE1/3/4